MYHFIFSKTQNIGQSTRLPYHVERFLFAFALTFLIRNRTRGFASGLAGSLALTAARARALVDAGTRNGLDVLHRVNTLLYLINLNYYT